MIVICVMLNSMVIKLFYCDVMGCDFENPGNIVNRTPYLFWYNKIFPGTFGRFILPKIK